MYIFWIFFKPLYLFKKCGILVAKKDHSDSDCFLMAVLSHGELGIIYARDTPFKSERLWSPFTADRCPTLAGNEHDFFNWF